MGCLQVLKEMLFRLKLYLFGIRFYEQATRLDGPPVSEAEYRLDSKHRIKFQFFRVECMDIVMKRGQLIGEGYPSYVVRAQLDENFPDDLRAYSGRSFFFNGRANRFRASEKMTIDLILDVYLDFLRTSMEKRVTLIPTS